VDCITDLFLEDSKLPAKAEGDFKQKNVFNCSRLEN